VAAAVVVVAVKAGATGEIGETVGDEFDAAPPLAFGDVVEVAKGASRGENWLFK
jgi:hypothetical protein